MSSIQIDDQPIIVIGKSGNMWFAAMSPYIDLVQNRTWWGNTPQEALQAYIDTIKVFGSNLE